MTTTNNASGRSRPGHRASRTVDLAKVLAEVDESLGSGSALRPWPTGFDPLDTYLSGGVRPGELVVLGGAQGLGKTTFALQIATRTLDAGAPVLYVSFEHEPASVLERVLVSTAGSLAGVEGLTLRDLRAAVEAGDGDKRSTLQARLATRAGAIEAMAVLDRQLPKFFVHRARPDTDIAEIGRAADEVTGATGARPLIVIDYLQKVFPGAEAFGASAASTEDERLVRVVNGAKDLALDLAVPVIAISAGDKRGITRGQRLRSHHLRGAASLAYEADVILIMNSKYDVVSRDHLAYGAANPARYRGWVVLTVEKNRTGQDYLDMEFRARYDQCRFERDGRPVAERLVDERIDRPLD